MRQETEGWVGHTRGTGVVNRVPVTTHLYDHSNVGIGTPNTAMYCGWDIDLSRINSIFGNSNTVTPLSKSCKFFIKYM